MKIETMDRASVKVLAIAVEQAMKQVAEDFGVTYAYKGGTFDPGTGVFYPKGEFSLPDSGRRAFERDAHQFGLTSEHFGATFVSNGQEFRVTGINTRAPKYPIKATCLLSGKPYKFPASVVSKIGA